SFGEGLEVLLQAEAEDRTHRRFERLKKGAQFRYQASVEELNLGASRGINKTQITELISGSYLKK
ncbi:MAG TPA: ATP-binding protein, partial [Arenibacter sp.]|nr:ATP-binding protein [Arenibacter sp.]